MEMFRPDPRSLAALRIGVALCILFDLTERVVDVGAFYSDAGILPRLELLNAFPEMLQRSICLLLSSGSVTAQWLWFAVAFVFAVMLLVGYHTRLATLCLWLLISSIQLRNPLIVFGAQVLLRLNLFWGFFVPWGAVWSVDARYRSAAPTPPRWDVRLGYVGLMLQIVAMLFIAGYTKWENPYWRDGTGLIYALDYELVVRPIGQLLAQWPLFCTLANHYVMIAEMLGALLLLSPVWTDKTRLVAVGLLVPAVIAFGTFLSVGIFPHATIVSLSVFLPSRFWDFVLPRLRSTLHSSAPALVARVQSFCAALVSWLAPADVLPRRAAPRPSRLGEWTASAVIVLAITYIVILHAGIWRDAGYVPPPWIHWFGKALHLDQKWGMFTARFQTGWFEIPGRLMDDRPVNLFAAQGPLPNESEAATPVAPPMHRNASMFRSTLWQVVFLGFAENSNFEPTLRSYARYLCRQWNDQHSGAAQLKDFEIRFVSRAAEGVMRTHSLSEYRAQALWRHECFWKAPADPSIDQS